ncbi:hypothetical protein [Erysipelothrix piscisicarius]
MMTLPQYQSDLNLYADIGNQPHLIHVVDEATPTLNRLKVLFIYVSRMS